MRQRRAEARLLDTSGKPGQNHTCKFPCMRLVRDNFFGFAWTSGPITKWPACSKLVRNGPNYPSPDPARFYWSCPFPPCLGASLALREKARRRHLSLPVPDHIPVRPQKRKSQCILLSRPSLELEWECSVSKVSKRQRGSQTGLLSAAMLICAGEDAGGIIRPGALIPHNE